MAKHQGDTVRVTATVPAEVIDVWREAAEVLGQSLSSLMAEWMGELVPGLQDVMRLRRAFELADEAQREKIRLSLAESGQAGQEMLLTAWDPVREAIGEAKRGDKPGSSHVE